MANHIELKYSEIDGMTSKLSMINTNYLDLAFSQLKLSTDLGSSIMQAGWHFGSKKEIFDTVKEAEKQIKKIETTNNNLIKVLGTVKSTYENDAASAAKSNKASWFKTTLGKIGIVNLAVINPTITSVVLGIWGSKKIISTVTNISTKNKPKINSAAKALLISGVTGLILKPSILPKFIKFKSDTVRVIGGEDGIKHRNISNLEKIENKVQDETQQIIDASGKYSELESVLAKYTNTPYVWGGNSTNGIDCSGLVMQAFKEAGIKTDFAHKASTIYTQCTPVGNYTKGNVDLSALKKGDLVFYSDGGPDAIKHVGIYVGDGNVMSALNPSEGVATKSINYTYKKNIYVARVTE